MENFRLGIHALTHITEASFASLNDSENLIRSFNEIVSGFNLCAVSPPIVHQFEPYGLTGFILLAESHISIHTWPELGQAAIDVFTCGDRCSMSIADKFAISVGAIKHNTQIITR